MGNSIDREKVIKGLECCVKESEWYKEPCGECPYGAKGGGCIDRLLADTITMLKEQEPRQVKVSEDYGSIKFGECPKCKALINNRYFPKSCGCGQAVKWE